MSCRLQYADLFVEPARELPSIGKPLPGVLLAACEAALDATIKQIRESLGATFQRRILQVKTFA